MALDVAKTILAQLGGPRFMAMTGAKNMLGSETDGTLQFRLPARLAKDGITAVRVKLEPTDTYTVTFFKVRGAKVATVAEVENVYCDTLRAVFEDKTGLVTSLGTMGGAR